MAISLVGTDIQINSGYATVNATGGTTETINGSGFPADPHNYRGRIIVATSGANAGESRAIKEATTTQITVFKPFSNAVASGHNFTICYDVRDIPDAWAPDLGSTHNRSKRTGYNIIVRNGGYFGGLGNKICFTSEKRGLFAEGTGFIQMGRYEGEYTDGIGIDGGSITTQMQLGGYWMNGRNGGTYRFFGFKWINNMQNVPVSANSAFIFANNGALSTTELTCVNSEFRDGGFFANAAVTLVDNKFVGVKAWMNTKGQTALDLRTVICEGTGSPRAVEDPGISGGDVFDTTYFGEPGGFTPRPTFLYLFNTPKGVAYYYNTDFGWDYQDAFYWYNNDGSGHIYECYSVKPVVKDKNAVGLQNVVIGCIDNAGNGGWLESKQNQASNYAPNRGYRILTDVSGEYTHPTIGGGKESGLIVRKDWTRLTALTSQSVDYNSFTYRYRLYDYTFLEDANTDYTERTEVSKTLIENPNITEHTVATVAGYTSVDTSQKAYDWSQYWLSKNTDESIKTKEYFFWSLHSGEGFLDGGASDIIFDDTITNLIEYNEATDEIRIKMSAGQTFTGNIRTTGTITWNGVLVNGLWVDSTGNNHLIRISNIPNGASVAVIDSNGDVQTGSYEANITDGTYNREFVSQTGTWKVVVKVQGYTHSVFEFDPSVGKIDTFSHSGKQILRADGGAAYTGTTPPATYVQVLYSNGTAHIEVGNTVISVQDALDASENFLVTQNGLQFLSQGNTSWTWGDLDLGKLALLTNNWLFRRQNTTDENAQVSGFGYSTGGNYKNVDRGNVIMKSASEGLSESDKNWIKALVKLWNLATG